jgi:hypothetical protein
MGLDGFYRGSLLTLYTLVGGFLFHVQETDYDEELQGWPCCASTISIPSSVERFGQRSIDECHRLSVVGFERGSKLLGNDHFSDLFSSRFSALGISESLVLGSWSFRIPPGMKPSELPF